MKGRASWIAAGVVGGLLAAGVIAVLQATWRATELAEKERQLVALRQDVANRDRQIEELASQVRRLEAQVASLQRELAARPEGPATTSSDAQSSVKMPQPLHEWFTFFPTRYPTGNWQPAHLAFDDCWFKTSDGVELHAWHCRHDKPRAAVLLAHGNAGNLSDWAEWVRYLHDTLAVSSLIFDYRGYGRSQGVATVPGILLDVRAARDEFARREGLAPQDVVLWGRSLGGAAIIDLAADEGARGVVAESTFTSLRDVAGVHYPPALVKLLVPDQLNSLGKIGRFRGPLLLSHGTADQTIPYSQGQQLFAAANQPKQFVPIAGGDHNSPQSAEFYRALDRFIAGLPPPAASD